MKRLQLSLPVLIVLLAFIGCEADDGVREDPEGTLYTLIIDTENPDAGVPIGVTPEDVDGKREGETPFERTFEEQVEVSLIAPAETEEAHPFSHWQIDGEMAAESTAITLMLDGDRQARAVFTPVWTLTIDSANPDSNVWIDITPEDRSGKTGGTTSFERRFVDGAEVHLTAPEESDGGTFLRWEIDGEPFSDKREMTVSMGEHHIARAVYSTTTTLTIDSNAPGIAVRSSPPDETGNDEGITPLMLDYLIGQHVELHPEAVTTDERYFRTWSYDGPELEGTQAIMLEVSREASATAYYAPAAAVLDTTYEVGGRPRGVPKNEMYRTLELDVVTEEAIQNDRVGVFYESAEGLLALPYTTRFDLSGDGRGETPVQLFYDLAPGQLTLRYRAETDGYVHPGWLPERVVLVLFEEEDTQLAMTPNP